MAKHPHFDDGGTLSWYTSWADAHAAAAAEGKQVLIEMGRELWGQCRTLVQGVLPQAGIAEILKAHFVGLASDCDAPEPQVIELASTHLADAMMLPFLMITNADGEFLAGSHGAVNPNTLQATLVELTT